MASCAITTQPQWMSAKNIELAFLSLKICSGFILIASNRLSIKWQLNLDSWLARRPAYIAGCLGNMLRSWQGSAAALGLKHGAMRAKHGAVVTPLTAVDEVPAVKNTLNAAIIPMNSTKKHQLSIIKTN